MRTAMQQTPEGRQRLERDDRRVTQEISTRIQVQDEAPAPAPDGEETGEVAEPEPKRARFRLTGLVRCAGLNGQILDNAVFDPEANRWKGHLADGKLVNALPEHLVVIEEDE